MKIFRKGDWTQKSAECHFHCDLLVKICHPFTYGSVYPTYWLHLWCHPLKMCHITGCMFYKYKKRGCLDWL